MEDVLDLYEEAPDPARPRVCLDEVPVQLLADSTPPTGPQPGRPAREDYEYDRAGTANLFVLCQPEAGWRHVEVTDRRTRVDCAHVLRDLVEVYFPTATVIRLVTDNLNIHTPAALYEAFPPAEARRLARKLEWHFTPKHGSWLNQVEIENSVLSKQCLQRRMATKADLLREVGAWEVDRNAAHATIDWQFTSRAAREKLKWLYPVHSA